MRGLVARVGSPCYFDRERESGTRAEKLHPLCSARMLRVSRCGRAFPPSLAARRGIRYRIGIDYLCGAEKIARRVGL